MPHASHRIRASVRLFFAALFVLVFVTPARAADTPCSSGDQTLSCRLHGLLSVLSVTAAVLGTVLVLALISAIWYYRRNRNKDLLPR